MSNLITKDKNLTKMTSTSTKVKHNMDIAAKQNLIKMSSKQLR
jgi:hypothetical protein